MRCQNGCFLSAAPRLTSFPPGHIPDSANSAFFNALCNVCQRFINLINQYQAQVAFPQG